MSHRSDRLADDIRGKVAVLITENLRDPRIGFTTVTRVELSADLQHARILVSVLGDDAAQEQTLKGLTSAAGYLRRKLGQGLRLRRIPELEFVIDHGPEEGIRIEKLLQVLHREDKDRGQ